MPEINSLTPTISVVTVVHNQAETIEQAINSVLNQSLVRELPEGFEYIVVDAMSDDGTHEIINSFSNQIQQYIREPDRGLYDALNKGITAATGDVVGFLHADDVLAHRDVLSNIANNFDEQVDAIYGDLMYVREDDPESVVRIWRSGEYRRQRFYFGWMPPHPTVYMRRSCYEKYGLFNLDMPTAADYEMLVRMMVRYRIRVRYVKDTLVKMRTGGKSNVSIKNRLLANQHDRMAWAKNGLNAPLGIRLMKPLRKIPQFLPFLYGKSARTNTGASNQ